MKTLRLSICLYAVFCFQTLFAQEEMGNGFLFTEFQQGTVVFKNGQRTSANLNYNMLHKEMLFKDHESNIMALANVTNIFVVIIEGRRFFPVSTSGTFYEEINAGNGSFFVQYKANVVSEGKEVGYGGRSQTSAVTSLGHIKDGDRYVKLASSEKFSLKREYFYYIKTGNTFKTFYSAKTLGKLFKGQAAKIEQFAKDHSINFSKIEDISKIVEYAYSIKI